MRATRLTAVLLDLAAIAMVATDASAYYHPRMGRFLSCDPGPGGPSRVGTAGPAVGGGFAPRDPSGSNQYADGMNLYQYVRGNPVVNLDPEGMKVYVVTRRAHAATIDGNTDAVTGKIGALNFQLARHWLPKGKREEEAKLREKLRAYRAAKWYLENSRHCILVVAKSCEKIYVVNPDSTSQEAAKPKREFKGIDIGKGKAWDYNNLRAAVTDELKGRGGKTAIAFQVSEITQLAKNDDKDALVTKIADAMTKTKTAADYSEFAADKKKRYNCCDWVVDVLRQAGLPFKNPSPAPFGDTPIPKEKGYDPEWVKRMYHELPRH